MKQMVHKMDILCQIHTRQTRIDRLKERWSEVYFSDMPYNESHLYCFRISNLIKRFEVQIDYLQMRLKRLY